MKKEQTKATIAAKAGMDEKTARKYMNLDRLPSRVKRPHDWRTRNDPFEKVWDIVKNMLKTNNGLESKTIFDDLQRKYPGKYSPSQLRTLQRRIKHWRATEGPAKKIYFPQKHYPGELSESDFTHLPIIISHTPFIPQKERFFSEIFFILWIIPHFLSVLHIFFNKFLIL